MPDRYGVPTRRELFNPLLNAIRALGGSASNQEIPKQVISDMDLPPEVSNVPHVNGNQTRLEYKLSRARTYLKVYGLLDNPRRGVWSLTPLGRNTDTVDEDAVIKYVRGIRRARRAQRPQVDEDAVIKKEETHSPDTGDEDEDAPDASERWRDALAETLRNIPPDAFERLCMRLLRESGFIEVKVTGRPRDGGIDGNGTIRIAGLISFPALFQCKRYKGAVSSGAVRDFRGAMVGRADKGLILTTGSFTAEAHKEATRDGAPPIDLIDGELLMDMLKDSGLGVRSKMVEVVEVDTGWFESI